MTRARRELVDLQTTSYYPCICRCVRRAFRCGEDRFSGKNYEHRKGWVLERLRTLRSVLAIDLCAYAIMSSHYYLVVHLNPEQGEEWTEEEVIERWQRLFSLPLLVVRYRAEQRFTKAEREKAQAIIATWRERRIDRHGSCAASLARRANAEDGGRFWEGGSRARLGSMRRQS